MMTTIANIAQRILDENGYLIAQFPSLTLTILEYKIDDCIDYVENQAGITLNALSGSAGSKSWTYTEPQQLAVKGLTLLLLRAYKQKGARLGVASMSIDYLESDPEFKLQLDILKKTIDRLKGPPIYVSNDPVETEE